MSRNGRLVREFADGRYEFFLGVKQLDELDELTGIGPYAMLDGLMSGTWRVQWPRQIIRLGLIGGGMKATEALKKVENYVDPPAPILDSLPLAIEVLSTALIAPKPKQKKKQPENDEPTTASISSSSMETVQ